MTDDLTDVLKSVLKSWPNSKRWMTCSEIKEQANSDLSSPVFGAMLRFLYAKGYCEREFKAPNVKKRSDPKLLAHYRITSKGLKAKLKLT